MHLVDTSIWLDALRRAGRGDVRASLRGLLAAGEAAWCAAVRLELWPSVRDSRERKILGEFEAIVTDLPMTGEVWEQAIETAQRARTKGVSCPYADLLIDSCGRIHKVELLHRDKHFEQLARL